MEIIPKLGWIVLKIAFKSGGGGGDILGTEEKSAV